MKRAIRATILVAVMAVTTYGGDMQNGATSTPPPPPPAAPTTASWDGNLMSEADGDMQNGVAGTVVEVSLSLLQTLLALV
jgi:hypothetical protein